MDPWDVYVYVYVGYNCTSAVIPRGYSFPESQNSLTVILKSASIEDLNLQKSLGIFQHFVDSIGSRTVQTVVHENIFHQLMNS